MRKLFKVILDCDDVLFMCNQKAIDLLNKEKGLDFKLADITKWGHLGNALDKRLEYFEDPDFVENLPLYPGAQEFVHELAKKAEVVIATNVPPKCAGARVNAIIKNFPDIKPSNILIGGRKDLLSADMMLDDAPQNLEAANVEYPVLFRQPWNYGKTGLLSVSAYSEFLTLADMVKSHTVSDSDNGFDAIVLVGPSGSGKKKFADKLMKLNPSIRRVSSYSTKSGAYYHSVTAETFDAMRESLFETSSYMGHLFGTRAEDIQSVIDEGNLPLLIMDVNGMIAMKSRFRTLSVFVKADKESCIKDVLMRGLSLEETVQRITAIDAEFRNEEFCDMTTANPKDLLLKIQQSA